MRSRTILKLKGIANPLGRRGQSSEKATCVPRWGRGSSGAKMRVYLKGGKLVSFEGEGHLKKEKRTYSSIGWGGSTEEKVGGDRGGGGQNGSRGP